jgi:hypothetical protein
MIDVMGCVYLHSEERKNIDLRPMTFVKLPYPYAYNCPTFIKKRISLSQGNYLEPQTSYPIEAANMAFMGGLRKHMPITWTTFLIGVVYLRCGMSKYIDRGA